MEAIQKEIAELQAKVKTLTDRLATIEAETKASLETIEEAVEGVLSAQKSAPATAASAPGLKGHIFKQGKEAFRLRFPTINVGGKDITEDDLLLDESLQKELLKNNPTLFVKA